MSTAWQLKTRGNPLAAVREFLARLWPVAGLDGLIAPVYQAPAEYQEPSSNQVRPIQPAPGLVPRLIEDPGQLAKVQPCTPLALANAASQAARLAQERPEGRYGALMRSCEARAWQKLARDAGVDQDRWLIIGIDCLACYPAEDFEWRLRRAGGIEALSRETLRFARQGGIAPYRYRRACQMCTDPDCAGVDLQVGLYGLPVKEQVLVLAKSSDVARRLQLEDLTSSPAPAGLVDQRQKMLGTVSRRRMGVRQRAIDSLQPGLPSGPVSLARHIASCTPCQNCLEACPIYAGEWVETGDTLAWRAWLQACLTCGLCEEACPDHLPLTALFARIKQDLRAQPLNEGLGAG